jgi:APA family basic amino acid/polyamine antiporter
VFRRRAARDDEGGYRVPGHPLTTLLFIAACWMVVINTIYTYPQNTVIGVAIMLAGIPAFFFWRWWRRDG